MPFRALSAAMLAAIALPAASEGVRAAHEINGRVSGVLRSGGKWNAGFPHRIRQIVSPAAIGIVHCICAGEVEGRQGTGTGRKGQARACPPKSTTESEQWKLCRWR
jgi:hypothetical protein